MWPKSWYPRKTFGEKLCFYLTIIIISCKCIIMVTVSMLRVGIVWCSVWATRTLYGEEVAKVQSRKGESAKMRRRRCEGERAILVSLLRLYTSLSRLATSYFRLFWSRLVFLKGLCLEENDDDQFVPRKLFIFRIDNLQKVSQVCTRLHVYLNNFLLMTFVWFLVLNFFLLSTKTVGATSWSW